ncbi:hypothetical protein [Aquabacterium sp.]|uniref:hypothetical protein n=1 Tax=Aquabacterium sp. TaxID=1872578 RepID=UPI0035C71FE6
MSTPDHETLRALGQVQGQLNGIADLIKETSAATNRRIDDLKATMDDRFQDHGERISRLESNERATAIKAAGIGAAAGAASGVVGQLLGALVKFKIGG